MRKADIKQKSKLSFCIYTLPSLRDLSRSQKHITTATTQQIFL